MANGLAGTGFGTRSASIAEQHHNTKSQETTLMSSAPRHSASATDVSVVDAVVEEPSLKEFLVMAKRFQVALLIETSKTYG